MRAVRNQARRPFWLPASNYYVLAVAISTAFFFLVWGILENGGEESPWISAGISASILLCGAVILREIVLRRARKRYASQIGVARRVSINPPTVDPRNRHKLSLEKNAAILREIRQKSDAAKVLSKLSAGHREVFELCRGYLDRNETELHTVGPGSPRLGALLKGRSDVANYHRYHLLKWAEIEAKTLADKALSRMNTDEKVASAQNALSVIDSALASYPAEASLIESREHLVELVVSIKVSHWVETAEKAAFNGNYAEAKSLYRDALFYLGRDNVQTNGRQKAAEHINIELERIRALDIDG